MNVELRDLRTSSNIVANVGRLKLESRVLRKLRKAESTTSTKFGSNRKRGLELVLTLKLVVKGSLTRPQKVNGVIRLKEVYSRIQASGLVLVT